LTTGESPVYTLPVVGRVTRAGIVVLALIAITTVLVTPDPTDDVSGLLNSAQVHFSFPWQAGYFVSLLIDLHQVAPAQNAVDRDFSSLIDTICARLC
jgi:hypothetical protein